MLSAHALCAGPPQLHRHCTRYVCQASYRVPVLQIGTFSNERGRSSQILKYCVCEQFGNTCIAPLRRAAPLISLLVGGPTHVRHEQAAVAASRTRRSVVVTAAALRCAPKAIAGPGLTTKEKEGGRGTRVLHAAELRRAGPTGATSPRADWHGERGGRSCCCSSDRVGLEWSVAFGCLLHVASSA
jgi:hypothetical protein